MTANIKYQRKLMIISTLAIIFIVRNLWVRRRNRRLIQMPEQASRHQSIDIPESTKDQGPKATVRRQGDDCSKHHGEKSKARSTATDGGLRSWVPTNVGGRRVSSPTGLVRDSSLWIEYGPRDCDSCREAQIAHQI